jgi:hypothetical protein
MVRQHVKQVHDRRLEALAARATGFSAEPKAVEALGQFNEPYANRLLLEIANDLDTNPSVRLIAISYLGNHGAPYGAQIAQFLIPQESLHIREASISALLKITCSEDCILSVLHYQERLSYGEISAEQSLPQMRMSDEVRKNLRTEIDQLEQDVNRVLQSNERTTLKVLVRTYGLGGPAPSSFALKAARVLQPGTVCPLLQQSLHARRDQQQHGDQLTTALESVINTHCTGGSHA